MSCPMSYLTVCGEDNTNNLQDKNNKMISLFPSGSVSKFIMFYSLSIVVSKFFPLPFSALKIKAEFKVSHQKDAIMLQGHIIEIKGNENDESVKQLKGKEFSCKLFSKDNNEMDSSMPFGDLSSIFPQFVPIDSMNWEDNETISGCPYILKNSSIRKKNGMISFNSEGIRNYNNNMERITIGKMTVKRNIEYDIVKRIPISTVFHFCTERHNGKILTEIKINLIEE